MQQKTGEHVKKLSGTKGSGLNSKKNLPEGVQKAYQKSYYSIFSTESKEMLIITEEWGGSHSPNSEAGRPRTYKLLNSIRKEKGTRTTPIQSNSNDEIHHLEY